MSNLPTRSAGSYMQYLPAIFQEGAGRQGPLGGLLLAFEQILSGRGDASRPGLEEVLGGIVDDKGATLLAGLQRYFEPGPGLPDSRRAPAEFMPWLAGWVALSLRADWSDDEKRRFISQIVDLYRLRGTRAGMIKMLQAYTDKLPVTIYEFAELPHYFQVAMALESYDAAALRRKELIARAIIDQEKPAHTFYALKVLVPTMQLGVKSRSTVGENTLLGSIHPPLKEREKGAPA
jgi:phage tail-like protein